MPQPGDDQPPAVRPDRRRAADLGLALAAGLALLTLAGCQPPAPAATPTPAPTVPQSPAPLPMRTAAPPPTTAPAPSATPVVASPSPAASPTPAASPSPTAAAAATPSPAVAAVSPTPASPRATPTTGALAAAPTPLATPLATASARPPATTATWLQSGADLASLSLTGVAFADGRVRLAPTNGRYLATGVATSPVRESGFPFDTAVLSWNAEALAGTSLRFELRARTAAGWTRWYGMGTWGAGGASIPGQDDAQADVDVDTLKLRAPASALQYRVTLSTTRPDATPALRLAAVAYSDGSRPLAGPSASGSGARGRELDVPRLSQLDQEPSLAWSVCSPTSLTMVLQFWGVQRSVPETIRGVRDGATGIYGNWPLNTAFAGAQGLQAFVDRFYSLEQLEAEVAAGRPPIASVRWRAGELDNAPVASTESGHLLVVRGFTAQGDVVVNDPVGRGEGVRRVYQRQQFARIWLDRGGIVYLVRPA